MPSTTTPIARTEQQVSGENKSQWGTRANRVFRYQEEAFGAVKTVNMTDADKTLTAGTFATDGEARAAVLNITGTLTQARTVTFPDSQKTYYVRNSTNQTLNLKSGSSGALELPTGYLAPVYTTGSNGIHFALNYLPVLTIDNVLRLEKDGNDAVISTLGERDIVIEEAGNETFRIQKNGTNSIIDAGGTKITFIDNNILFTRNSDGLGTNLDTLLGTLTKVSDLERRVAALERG